MGGAKGTQATGSGFRAAVYARLEEISFRTGLITAASALVVLAALTTAGVLVAGRGQGAHRADASPVITSSAAAPVATLASVPPASPVSTAKPVPSSTQQATHAPVTTDATASRAVATPQPTAGSPTAAQATGSQGHDSRPTDGHPHGQPKSYFPSSGHQGGAIRLSGFAGSRRLPG